MTSFFPIPLRGVSLLIVLGVLAACSPVGGPLPPSPQPGPPSSPDTGRPAIPPPGVPDTWASPASGRMALDRLPAEVRALWVVRTTLNHPDSIRAMVDRAHRAGFNTLIVQVRGRGDAYYASRWEPAAEGIETGDGRFDPLDLVIREAHARGLMVHAWVNTHLIAGLGALPAAPSHIVSSRPDLLAVPRELAWDLFDMDPEDPRYVQTLLDHARANRERVEGLYTSPSSPEVKEHVYAIWMDLLESYDLDGLHFDYIRYPNPDFDYSRGALERFRSWVSPRLSPARMDELNGAYMRNPLAFVEALPGPWNEFRRAQISDLVERIYFGVKKRRPDVLVSAAVFADADDADRSRFQDWRGWLRNGVLDVVVPMAYTPDNAAFERQIRTAVDAAGAGRVWAGVGVYQNTYAGTLDKIRIARSLGARGVALFSYDWAVAEGESDGGRSFLDRVGAELFSGR